MNNRNDSQEKLTEIDEQVNNALETMLGPRIDISDVESEMDPERINAISFELYKEALSVVNVTGHIFIEEDGTNVGWLRDQAICASLIIRMAKFMLVIVELSAKGDRADVIAALNRSIMESAINLEFLAKAFEDDAFNRFVVSSLGPERELYDWIQANIQARQGEMLPIERRMLNSIDDLCRASGITIDEVKRNAGDWAGGLRERLKVLGKESQYVAMVRLSSHAVHGTWVDLYKKHLRQSSTENRFTPKSDFSWVDERSLGPVTVLTLEAIKPYLARFFDELPVR